MGLKTGDLDLDLQGQIGLETSIVSEETCKFCLIPCECNNHTCLCIFLNLPFKLETLF